MSRSRNSRILELGWVSVAWLISNLFQGETLQLSCFLNGGSCEVWEWLLGLPAHGMVWGRGCPFPRRRHQSSQHENQWNYFSQSGIFAEITFEAVKLDRWHGRCRNGCPGFGREGEAARLHFEKTSDPGVTAEISYEAMKLGRVETWPSLHLRASQSFHQPIVWLISVFERFSILACISSLKLWGCTIAMVVVVGRGCELSFETYIA